MSFRINERAEFRSQKPEFRSQKRKFSQKSARRNPAEKSKAEETNPTSSLESVGGFRTTRQ
jgi:hypothetical protein